MNHFVKQAVSSGTLLTCGLTIRVSKGKNLDALSRSERQRIGIAVVIVTPKSSWLFKNDRASRA